MDRREDRFHARILEGQTATKITVGTGKFDNHYRVWSYRRMTAQPLFNFHDLMLLTTDTEEYYRVEIRAEGTGTSEPKEVTTTGLRTETGLVYPTMLRVQNIKELLNSYKYVDDNWSPMPGGKFDSGHIYLYALDVFWFYLSSNKGEYKLLKNNCKNYCEDFGKYMEWLKNHDNRRPIPEGAVTLGGNSSLWEFVVNWGVPPLEQLPELRNL